MNMPVRLFVLFPDGDQYPVESIEYSRDGTVRRITTSPQDGKPPGAWWDIQDGDLRKCRLIVRAVGVEYWSEPEG